MSSRGSVGVPRLSAGLECARHEKVQPGGQATCADAHGCLGILTRLPDSALFPSPPCRLHPKTESLTSGSSTQYRSSER